MFLNLTIIQKSVSRLLLLLVVVVVVEAVVVVVIVGLGLVVVGVIVVLCDFKLQPAVAFTGWLRLENTPTASMQRSKTAHNEYPEYDTKLILMVRLQFLPLHCYYSREHSASDLYYLFNHLLKIVMDSYLKPWISIQIIHITLEYLISEIIDVG